MMWREISGRPYLGEGGDADHPRRAGAGQRVVRLPAPVPARSTGDSIHAFPVLVLVVFLVVLAAPAALP